MEYILYGHVTPPYKRITLKVEKPPFEFFADSVLGKFSFKLLLNDTDDIVVLISCNKEIKDLPTLIGIVKCNIQSLYDAAFLNSGVLAIVNITLCNENRI